MIIRDTRFRIEWALFELMKETDFSGISVNQIVSRAHCSRATFYRLYNSKKDVIITYLTEIIEDLHARSSSMQTEDYYLEVFRYMRLDKERILLLLKNGFLPDMLRQVIRITAEDPVSVEKTDTLRYYQACANSGMLFAILYAWAMEGFKTEPEILLKAMQGLYMS